MRTVRIGAELDRETHAAFDRWASDEGRSKRRHAAILLRKLTALRKTHGEDLAKLGLIDKAAAVN